jgi:CheY-like chemotaxis protein
MQGILVMIVEDDVLIQLEIEAVLHDGGYSTDTESSGEAAIGRLETNPDIRGLITDINLIGNMTGWDVARRAREIFPDMPVIYVTSASAEDWTAQGVPKSILIQKPFAPAQITTAISQLLNAGEPLATKSNIGQPPTN